MKKVKAGLALLLVPLLLPFVILELIIGIFAIFFGREAEIGAAALVGNIISNFRETYKKPHIPEPDQELLPGGYYTPEMFDDRTRRRLTNNILNMYNNVMKDIVPKIKPISQNCLNTVDRKANKLTKKRMEVGGGQIASAKIITKNFAETFNNIKIPKGYTLTYTVKENGYNLVTGMLPTVSLHLKNRLLKTMNIEDSIYLEKLDACRIYELIMMIDYLGEFRSAYGWHSQYASSAIINYPPKLFVKEYNKGITNNLGGYPISADVSGITDFIPKIGVYKNTAYARLLYFNAWKGFYYDDFILMFEPCEGGYKLKDRWDIDLKAIVPFDCGIRF